MANKPYTRILGNILPPDCTSVLAQFTINGETVRLMAHLGRNGWYPTFPDHWHDSIICQFDADFPLPLADWWMEIPE